MENGEEYFVKRWTEVMPAVEAFLSTMLPYHDAQDVLQEVAVTLYNKMDVYDETKSFAGFAIGIARRKSLAHRRKYARRKLLYNSDIIEKLELLCEKMAPELDYRMSALNICIKSIKMKGKSKAVFDYRYREELPPRRIAEEVGIRAGTVRVILSRVRDALRDCVNQRILKEKRA